MTRIISAFTFFHLYLCIYMSPFIILLIIDGAFNLNLLQYFERLGSFKGLVGLCVLVYAIILPGYRAKLASAAYGERDMKFWEAHSVSGTVLRSQLSFLPIVGNLFKKKGWEEDKDNFL